MTTTINADNGVVSGSAGLKSSADSSGVLALQTNGTTAVSIDASQAVSFTNAPTVTGGTANGVAYLNGSKVLTTGSSLVFNGTNLGVGVTPSAWRNLFNVVQSGQSSAFVGQTNSNTTYVASNWYSTSGGTDTRIAAGYASQYYQDSGQHVWRTAGTSTAGSAITFTQAMTLQTGTYGGQQLLLNTTAVGNAGTSGTLVGSRLSVGVIPYSGSAYGCIRIQDTSSGTAFLSEWGILADGDGNPSTTISYQVGLYLCAGINGGTAKIYFDGSGNAYKSSGAGSWSALSDSRIKTNVQTVTNGLSRILQLNPVTFDYKSPEAHNGKVNDKGFIADEFMQVYPDSVTETEFVPDEDKQYIEKGAKAKAMGFNAEFYADLVSCIQEQQALITQLQADVAALKGASA
jgi:hypothetical protein